ncbi:MAG: hypothetical protein NTX87_09190, partial [Planctomycetota bacterium]|nr:hypothetical protein [Planctomycetota bacterium]
QVCNCDCIPTVPIPRSERRASTGSRLAAAGAAPLPVTSPHGVPATRLEPSASGSASDDSEGSTVGALGACAAARAL